MLSLIGLLIQFGQGPGSIPVDSLFSFDLDDFVLPFFVIQPVHGKALCPRADLGKTTMGQGLSASDLPAALL